MGEKSIQNISDEMIMAYVDGELGAGQTKIVEHALETDPALQEKAAMFSETTSMLAGVYDGPLQEEVPTRLLKTVQSYPAGSWWQRAAKKIRRAVRIPVMSPAPAFALMAVLIIGGWLLYPGNFFNPSTGGNYPAFAKGDAFSQGLDSTPGGRLFPVAGFAARVSPVATFTDRNNRYCRRFDVLDGSDNNQIIGCGIACRDQAKQWQTIVYQQVPEKGSAPSARSSFELAGSSNPVNNVMNKEARNLLSDQQVRALIKNGWTDSP
jgi:hypothetical protein